MPCIGHRQQVCSPHSCMTWVCTRTPEPPGHNSKHIKKCIQTSCLQLGGLPWKPLTCCAFQVSMSGAIGIADTGACSCSVSSLLPVADAALCRHIPSAAAPCQKDYAVSVIMQTAKGQAGYNLLGLKLHVGRYSDGDLAMNADGVACRFPQAYRLRRCFCTA